MSDTGRQARMHAGIVAIHDAMRVLRSHGAASRAAGDPTERGALFELAALHERMVGFAEDQSADDWDEFWVTNEQLVTFRTHVGVFRTSPRGLASTTLPALDALAEDLADVIARMS